MPAPPTILYITQMSRPDAALALAMLHAYDTKRAARIGAVAVSGSGFSAAQFCDVMDRYYLGGGPTPNSNIRLPVGFSADDASPDQPVVNAVLPKYPGGIKSVSDTAEVLALLRNALTNTQDSSAVVILSAPARILTRELELFGVKQLFAAKVKLLILCDSGLQQDADTLREILALPVLLVPREVGEALRFPASRLEEFPSPNPAVDAYRAFHDAPYDAPTWDMIAMLYAAHPELVSSPESGAIQVGQDGSLRFVGSAEGKHRVLRFDPARRDKMIEAMIEAASVKPAPRQRPPVKKQP